MFEMDAAAKVSVESGAGVDGSIEGSSRLVKEEEKAIGGLSKRATCLYVRAAGGPCVVAMLAVAFLVFVGAQMFANVWLQYWVDSMQAKKTAFANETSTQSPVKVDIRVPFFLEMVVQSLLSIALQLLISVYVYKVFSIVLGASVVVYLLLDRWLNVGVREVKKLDNVARSAVIVHLATTLQGVAVIRVFGCHKWFTNK
ncbi:hypothetical protein V5799_033706 [Amblyomma americanum]|uniref:Uncharacterized protein n=1 Tax=Amblyomma americanum TaxID=6943 RepID=A0AAQ4DMK1_AMBAM